MIEDSNPRTQLGKEMLLRTAYDELLHHPTICSHARWRALELQGSSNANYRARSRRVLAQVTTSFGDHSLAIFLSHSSGPCFGNAVKPRSSVLDNSLYFCGNNPAGTLSCTLLTEVLSDNVSQEVETTATAEATSQRSHFL